MKNICGAGNRRHRSRETERQRDRETERQHPPLDQDIKIVNKSSVLTSSEPGLVEICSECLLTFFK